MAQCCALGEKRKRYQYFKVLTECWLSASTSANAAEKNGLPVLIPEEGLLRPFLTAHVLHAGGRRSAVLAAVVADANVLAGGLPSVCCSNGRTQILLVPATVGFRCKSLDPANDQQ